MLQTLKLRQVARQGSYSCVIVAAILALLPLPVTPASADPAAPSSTSPATLEKIRLSADGNKFALADSGKPFVPWGFNYLGSFGEIIEESWATDWPRLEKDFREM